MLKSGYRHVAIGASCIAAAAVIGVAYVVAYSPSPTVLRFQGITADETGAWNATFLVTNHTDYRFDVQISIERFSLRSDNEAPHFALVFGTVRLHGVEFPNAAGATLYQSKTVNAHEAHFARMEMTEKTNVARVRMEMLVRRPSWQCQVIKALATCHLYVYDQNGSYGPTVLRVGGAMPRAGLSWEKRYILTNSWLLITP